MTTPHEAPQKGNFDLGKKVDEVISGAKHLNRNRKIVLAGALVAFIATFLPWWQFKYSVLGYPLAHGTWNGFHSGGTASFIMSLIALFVLFMPYVSKKHESIKNDNIIYLCIGVIGAISILATLGIYSSALSFGIFLALIGQIAIIAGGYLEFRKNKKPTKQNSNEEKK